MPVGLNQKSLPPLFLRHKALLEAMRGTSAGTFGNSTKLVQVSSQSGQSMSFLDACICVVDPSKRLGTLTCRVTVYHYNC